MNASRLITFDLVAASVVRTHRRARRARRDRRSATASRLCLGDRRRTRPSRSTRKTGRVLARAPAGSYPDGLAYDPVERHVFVSDETGGVETVLEREGATYCDGLRWAERRGTSSTTRARSTFSSTCSRGTRSPSSTRERTRWCGVSAVACHQTMASTSTPRGGWRSSHATATRSS